ncbi:MAG TPA: AMP-binding protein [Candidatus Nanopelagicaceae bacterium]
MESLVSRDLLAIDAKWSTPQLLEALLRALTGDGPALSTAPLPTSVSPDVALVVMTSGSTGAPKSVALSSRALIANARATHKFIGANVGDRWSLLLPTTHIAGLNVLIRSIELGTIPVTIENSADFTAIVPTQLHRALTSDSRLFNHLKGCRAILVGGAPLSEELRKLASGRGLNIVTTYGTTETCGGVVYNGIALEGIEFKLKDGRIAIKGPQLASGYLESELPMDDGWFITSDLGEIQDGKLIVLGRIDDQIISGGEKISLSAIESYLQNEFANQEIVAFGKADPEWGEKLCIATTQALSIDAVSTKLKSKFGSHVSPKEVHTVRAIPYLSIGKPDRNRLANDFA